MSEMVAEKARKDKMSHRIVKLNLPGSDSFFVQEAFKLLRTNVQFCGSQKKVIFITSCNENEGKTTITLHLAKSFAALGKRVLVLDADMRKSVMAGRNASVNQFFGLSELLTDLKSFDECLLHTEDENLHILFAGKFPPNPVELLDSEKFSHLLEQLRESYDYIFVDTPPLGVVVDAAVIAPDCDGGILVLSSHSRYKQAQTLIDQINKSGCKFLGVVRNRVAQKKHSYYYYQQKKD